MNQTHLKALLAGSSDYNQCVIPWEDQVLVTEGYFVILTSGFPVTEKPRFASQVDGMKDAWLKYNSESLFPLIVTDHVEMEPATETYVRKVETAAGHVSAVNEAFYRILAGEGVSWFWSGHPKQPFVVCENGKKIAIVMYVEHCFVENTAPPMPTDTQVFQKYACEANQYYLQEDSVLIQEIARIEKKISRLESQISDLEGEKEEWEEDLEEKRELLKKRQQPAEAA